MSFKTIEISALVTVWTRSDAPSVWF